MQFLLTLLVASVATVQTFWLTSQGKRSDPVLVRAVTDGDTIDVTTFGRVRLLGIDAPEIGRGFDTSAPFGRAARRSPCRRAPRRARSPCANQSRARRGRKSTGPSR